MTKFKNRYKFIITMIIGTSLLLTLFILSQNNNKNTVNPQSHADWQYFESLESITIESDVTLLGNVVSVETRDINIDLNNQNAEKFQYNVYKVKVVNPITSTLKDEEVIEVKILSELEANKDKIIEVGKEYIFFLELYDNNIPASLLNLEQANLLIQNNKIIIENDNNILFAEESDNLSGSLTVEELIKLIKEYDKP